MGGEFISLFVLLHGTAAGTWLSSIDGEVVGLYLRSIIAGNLAIDHRWICCGRVHYSFCITPWNSSRHTWLSSIDGEVVGLGFVMWRWIGLTAGCADGQNGTVAPCLQ